MPFFNLIFYFPTWCTDPAKIGTFQHEYIAEVQQSVSLKCEAEGNPPPTYTWTPCGPEQVCNKNTLQISQVLDDANYTCRVANVHGLDSKTANVCKSHVHCSHAPNSCIFIHAPTRHFDWVLRVKPGVSLSGCKSPNSALLFLMDNSLFSLNTYNVQVQYWLFYYMLNVKKVVQWLTQRWLSKEGGKNCLGLGPGPLTRYRKNCDCVGPFLGKWRWGFSSFIF